MTKLAAAMKRIDLSPFRVSMSCVNPPFDSIVYDHAGNPVGSSTTDINFLQQQQIAYNYGFAAGVKALADALKKRK